MPELRKPQGPAAFLCDYLNAGAPQAPGPYRLSPPPGPVAPALPPGAVTLPPPRGGSLANHQYSSIWISIHQSGSVFINRHRGAVASPAPANINIKLESSVFINLESPGASPACARALAAPPLPPPALVPPPPPLPRLPPLHPSVQEASSSIRQEHVPPRRPSPCFLLCESAAFGHRRKRHGAARRKGTEGGGEGP